MWDDMSIEKEKKTDGLGCIGTHGVSGTWGPGRQINQLSPKQSPLVSMMVLSTSSSIFSIWQRTVAIVSTSWSWAAWKVRILKNPEKSWKMTRPMPFLPFRNRPFARSRNQRSLNGPQKNARPAHWRRPRPRSWGSQRFSEWNHSPIVDK